MNEPAISPIEPATDSQILDVAARQRMLNQRLGKEVFARVVGAGAAFEPTLKLLGETARSLAFGGEVQFSPNTRLTVPPAPSAELAAEFSKQCDLLVSIEKAAWDLTGSSEPPQLYKVSELLATCDRFHEAANRATVLVSDRLTALRNDSERRERETVEKLQQVLNLAIGQTQRVSASALETERMAGDVSQSSHKIMDVVQSVAGATEQLHASIREISSQAHLAAQNATAAVTAAQQSKESMANLQSIGRNIGQVVKLISSVAQQTNLLALNATIEAVRAGNAGKGFAVVATEVKELARQTGSATDQIGNQIETIQGDTKRAIDSMTEIDLVVENLCNTANGIAAAVKQQAVAATEIARSMSEASGGVTNINRHVSAVVASARQTSLASVESIQAATQLAGVTTQLQAHAT
jgi:methyl-accepting chemotaxis protein